MQITIRIPDQYGSKLNRLSKEMGMRRSDIIRLAMKQFLDGTEEAAARRSPYLRISHLLGVVESDVKDLGQSHRKYLIQRVRRASR